MESKRLTYAKIDGPGVTLAYMADDKNFVCCPGLLQCITPLTFPQVEPLEALFRSLLLVFMDNATAEYTFISSFFINEPLQTVASSDSSSLFSPTLLSPTQEHASFGGSELGEKRRTASVSSFNMTTPSFATAMKEDQAAADSIWKQVMDPVLEYCQVSWSSLRAHVQTVLMSYPPDLRQGRPGAHAACRTAVDDDPPDRGRRRRSAKARLPARGIVHLHPPPATMARIPEGDVGPCRCAEEARGRRECRLLQPRCDDYGGYFDRGTTIWPFVVCITHAYKLVQISKRYVSLFTSFVTLTEQEEEAMIFSKYVALGDMG